MEEKYSLNSGTLRFLTSFEDHVKTGKCYTIQELVDVLEGSPFNKEQFNFYKKMKNSSLWYELKLSGKWEMQKKGVFIKK
ncbi:hypothetical protein AB7942_23775 [Neobacillus sp. BF23-41]|uniref:hypothetical protein n=1 Tax=Neobacillus sp. BF23-41 TaxID=3240280 RepID=UPI0034E49303